MSFWSRAPPKTPPLETHFLGGGGVKKVEKTTPPHFCVKNHESFVCLPCVRAPCTPSLCMVHMGIACTSWFPWVGALPPPRPSTKHMPVRGVFSPTFDVGSATQGLGRRIPGALPIPRHFATCMSGSMAQTPVLQSLSSRIVQSRRSKGQAVGHNGLQPLTSGSYRMPHRVLALGLVVPSPSLLPFRITKGYPSVVRGSQCCG